LGRLSPRCRNFTQSGHTASPGSEGGRPRAVLVAFQRLGVAVAALVLVGQGTTRRAAMASNVHESNAMPGTNSMFTILTFLH
jgi:hypothetical protein